MDRKTLLSRIKTLLDIAQRESSNRHEAAAAAAKAARLIRDYNLSQDEVRFADVSEDFVKSRTKRIQRWEYTLFEAVCTANYCRVIIVEQDPPLGTCYSVIGQEHNVECSLEMIRYLRSAIDRLVRDYRKSYRGKPSRWRRNARIYKNSLVAALLLALKQQGVGWGSVAPGSLVVIGNAHSRAIDEYVAVHYPVLIEEQLEEFKLDERLFRKGLGVAADISLNRQAGGPPEQALVPGHVGAD